MIIDGLRLVEGSTTENLTVASGADFPSVASTGELFIKAGQLYMYSGSEWTAVGASSSPEFSRYLSMPGALEVFTGVTRWYPTQNTQITKISAGVNVAPTGANIVVSLKKNGVEATTYSITAGTNKGSVVDLTSLNITATENDYFTIDITSVGSTVAGSDLVVTLMYINL